MSDEFIEINYDEKLWLIPEEELEGENTEFDSEDLFGISRSQWNSWEKGTRIQSRTSDNYLRILFGKEIPSGTETCLDDNAESADL